MRKQALIRSIEDIGRFTSRLAKASWYLDFSAKNSGFGPRRRQLHGNFHGKTHRYVF